MVEYKEIEIWKSYSEYLKELNEIKDPYGADYEKLTYLLKKLETMYFGYVFLK